MFRGHRRDASPSVTGVFFFFSSRTGCLGSILISALVTIILLLILDIF